jgi:hypothetical protein
MPTNFTGTLRMETGSAMGGMTAVGLRARWNERGEFLFTTESAGASAPEGEILIPHFALGPGYQTRFVLVGGDAPSSGTVQFFDPAGAPAALPLR